MNKNKIDKKIRVLLVDDSFFMRKLLKEMLEKYDDLEVIEEAKDGEDAIGKIVKLKPDVVTMDYNMPKMNGIETIEEIVKIMDKPPKILMLSAYTKEGTDVTMQSLRAGAVDYIPKTSGELSLDIEIIEKEIVDKIRIASSAKVLTYKEIKPKKKIKIIEKKIDLVVIGASTGGPPLVESILKALPKDFCIPVIIVQHIPEYFSSSMSKRINQDSKATVKEAEHNEIIKPGICYIAPGGYHLKLSRSTIKHKDVFVKLNKEEPEHGGLRPSIDITMKSVAEVYGENVLAIELTGMGNDGREGMKVLKKVGAYNIAQDTKTTVISSMPQSVIDADVVDDIMTPEEIVSTLINLNSKK